MSDIANGERPPEEPGPDILAKVGNGRTKRKILRHPELQYQGLSMRSSATAERLGRLCALEGFHRLPDPF